MPTKRQGISAMLLLLASAMGLAQCEPSEPRAKKAEKYLEKATNSKGNASVQDRLEWIDLALEIEPEDPELLMEAAELAFKTVKQNSDQWAVLTMRLDELEAVCPDGMPEALFLRGAHAYAQNRYGEGWQHFQSYLDFPENETRRSRRREAMTALPKLKFLEQYYAHADREAPLPMPSVSTQEDEYLPLISPDGSLLFFTRTLVEKRLGDVTSTRKELFTCAERSDDNSPFDEGIPLGKPFNAGTNCGGGTISTDNKLMIFAADRPTPRNPNNVDLFSTEYHVHHRDGDGQAIYIWSEIVPLGDHINTELGWESQPSISADGTTLYFAAARAESTPDGNGNPTMDIYRSLRAEDGRWGDPEKLPAPVNSASQDKAPFLHPDGRSLYFSSNREPGGGGYDVWLSRQDSTGSWGEPVNLGLPLNSSGDEHGLVVSTDGKSGILASRRDGTSGLDLCTYPLPEELQPDPVTVVTGDLGWPLPEGELTVNIEYVQSKRVEQIQISAEDGTFAHVVKLQDGEDVVMTVEGTENGYQSMVIHEDGTEFGNSVSLDFEQHPDPGSTPSESSIFELPDVQFETNEATLSSRSLAVLGALANRMERRPELLLHIKGHTDNIGDAQSNLTLSMDRANAVRAFLMSRGIEQDRMQVEGVGATEPKQSNATTDGRRVNRRTEFRWVN